MSQTIFYFKAAVLAFITEWQYGRGWQGPLESTWSHPCSRRDTQSRPPRATSRRFLEISEEIPTASWGSLCQCPVTSSVHKCSLVFRWSLLCSSLCPVLLLLALKRTRLHLFCILLCAYLMFLLPSLSSSIFYFLFFLFCFVLIFLFGTGTGQGKKQRKMLAIKW